MTDFSHLDIQLTDRRNGNKVNISIEELRRMLYPNESPREDIHIVPIMTKDKILLSIRPHNTGKTAISIEQRVIPIYANVHGVDIPIYLYMNDIKIKEYRSLHGDILIGHSNNHSITLYMEYQANSHMNIKMKY